MLLRIQSVLFHNDPASVRRAVRATCAAAQSALHSGRIDAVDLVYGDCSDAPALDEAGREALQRECEGTLRLDYRYFDANLGSARGHNQLYDDSDCAYLLIMNPDIVMSANALVELANCLDDPEVGMAEARQIPLEHPKAYDPHTLQTSWAATACALIRPALFRRLGGFDSDTFFLYCDDVDFSWRVRLAGSTVVYCPTASAFHDKRLEDDASMQPGAAERYYAAEAALLLTFKWSRPDLTRQWLRMFSASPEDALRRAAGEFRRREAAGQLPEPVDADHRVAQFVGQHYARHRFPI